MIQRGIGVTKGKWDVFIVQEEGRKSFRSKTELQKYIDEHRLPYTSDAFDFSLDDLLKRLRQIWKQHIVKPHLSIAYELAIAPEKDGLDLQTLLGRIRATSALNRDRARQEISKSKCFSHRGGKWCLNANVKGGLCQKCLKIRHSKAKFQAKFLDNVQARKDHDPLS